MVDNSGVENILRNAARDKGWKLEKADDDSYRLLGDDGSAIAEGLTLRDVGKKVGLTVMDDGETHAAVIVPKR